MAGGAEKLSVAKVRAAKPHPKKTTASDIDVSSWLVESLRVEFNRREGIVFLAGDGVNQPSGLLTCITGGANDGTHPGGNLTVVEGAIDVEPLIDFMYGLAAPTAGNLAIAFGDFQSGYLINDRIGTRILRDPYTNKPFVNFYATKRVGAGLLDPNAIRLLRLPV